MQETLVRFLGGEDPLEKGKSNPLQYSGLENSTNCSLPGASIYGGSPGKNSVVGYHALLQGIFPTQESNPGLPHCRQILYIWATKKPKNTEVGTPSLLQGIFPTQEWTGGLLHCRQILYQLSYREERKGNGKLFFNVYKVSVMQNEYVLEICYTTVSTVNNMTSCIKTC